jgi:hypothetical protein
MLLKRLAAASLALAAAGAAAAPKRNVLYIVFDDLRPDLSPYQDGREAGLLTQGVPALTFSTTIHPPYIYYSLLKMGHPLQAQGCQLRGSWGSHRTPWHPVEDPLDPLQIEKTP